MIYKKQIEELVGKTVVSHTLADDGSKLRLTCEDGTVALFDPEGDCCSMSWIESIDDENALHGVIQDIEEIDMPDLGNIDGQRHQGVDSARMDTLEPPPTYAITKDGIFAVNANE